MQPPLFVWEPNELLAFETVEALEGFIEPPDVDSGRAFDAEGRLLSVQAERGRTVVREAESQPSHQDELRAALITALADAEGDGVRSAPLDELVALGVARFAVSPPTNVISGVMRLFSRRRR